MNKIEIDWLRTFAENWRQRVRQARIPHALMLAGRAGLGKRAAAAWLAGERLSPGSGGDTPCWPWSAPGYADLHWICPPGDRHSIGVEQIRELVAEIALTSYEGRGKVAVVEPANAMTDNAANSLLKTLEEPPGDALIVLVVDRVGRLPATVFSRCQRVNVPQPDARTSLAWLERCGEEGDWSAALRLAGGAPLGALVLRDQVELAQSMAREFADVAEGRTSPLDVAAGWSKLEPAFVLDWLAGEVQGCIRRAAGSPRDPVPVSLADSVLHRMDTRNLFCYLDIINGLRGQAPGTFNVALTLESLLIDWSEGLAASRGPFAPGELLPETGTG